MLMLCVYLLCENTKLYYLYIEVIQSTLMCYIPKFLRKKYIPLSNLNFNDVVTSRGNWKVSLIYIYILKKVGHHTKISDVRKPPQETGNNG